MALRRHISTCPSYLGKTKLVLWVIVTVVHSGVESFSANSEVKSAEIPLLSENTISIAYSRYKRSNEDRGMHSVKNITDLNSTVDHGNASLSGSPYVSSGITSLKDNYNEKKIKKTNKLNKPYGVDKDSSKVAFETKYPSHNLSNEGKQKNVTKVDKQNKTEDEFSVAISESNSRSNTSNTTVLDTSYYKSLNSTNNDSIGSEIIVKNMTNTRVIPAIEENTQNDSIPSEMNDQPIEQTDDLTLNNTLPEDDCIDPSVTNCTEIGSNRTVYDGRTMPDTDGSNLLLISGACLSSVVLLSTAAGGGYMVYRRRLWNKPQTLSDKCSNADSSGYIDDSTLRENSEEMYSLDNDSFLNSLEAMTIQNYWTDNVKHTKL